MARRLDKYINNWFISYNSTFLRFYIYLVQHETIMLPHSFARHLKIKTNNTKIHPYQLRPKQKISRERNAKHLRSLSPTKPHICARRDNYISLIINDLTSGKRTAGRNDKDLQFFDRISSKIKRNRFAAIKANWEIRRVI